MRTDLLRLLRGAPGACLTAGSLLLTLTGQADAQGMHGGHGMEWERESLIVLDEIEYAPGVTGNPLALDVVGWIGGPYNRLWFRAEGEQATTQAGGEGEVQLLYGRLISPYWDALIGVRLDGHWGDDDGSRALLAAGLEGLAPYWFELAPTLFVSQEGDVSARLEASYELLITQRLVLEPELELDAALQEVPEFGVGSGLNAAEMGLRLRYEFRREFAPYVGVSWARRTGRTAALARDAGEPVTERTFVAGLRIWR